MLVGRADREHFARGLVAAADRDVVGLHGVRLEHQAGARAPGLVGAVEVDVLHAVVVIFLAEDVVAHTHKRLPLGIQLDQVLHVQACGLLGVGAL
ncbi:hypothetical protein D3C81_1674680 [compost metagenome]